MDNATLTGKHFSGKLHSNVLCMRARAGACTQANSNACSNNCFMMTKRFREKGMDKFKLHCTSKEEDAYNKKQFYCDLWVVKIFHHFWWTALKRNLLRFKENNTKIIEKQQTCLLMFPIKNAGKVSTKDPNASGLDESRGEHYWNRTGINRLQCRSSASKQASNQLATRIVTNKGTTDAGQCTNKSRCWAKGFVWLCHLREGCCIRHWRATW